MIKKIKNLAVVLCLIIVTNVQARENFIIDTSTADGNAKELELIKVVGSRAVARTDINRPVPVDIISSKYLENTGQIDLGQMVQYSSPSFNSAKNGINGVANFADPATIRGMSPDQSVVLINGKRRHQFSAINANVTVGKGTVVTDLNSIPALAVERMEVLRDGAAAQYGSDAIAGIMNISLKKTVGAGTFKSQVGINRKGDGETVTGGLNYGVSLGKKGSYANFTVFYSFSGLTDRADPYRGRVYNATKATDDSIRNARDVWPTTDSAYVTKYGSNQTKAYQAFVNIGYPISKDWMLYSFGGYSFKDIKAYGFFRNAINTGTTSDNANSNIDLYPNGYTPELPGQTQDWSAFAGIKKESEQGWNIDFSTGYGQNYLKLFANNTSNPSMGAASLKNFYVGQTTFRQSTSEANVSKNFANFLGTQSFNLAFGGQFRVDNFQMAAGDEGSYLIGPLAATNNKAPGSSGRFGISPADVVNVVRNNIGLYADVESDVSKELLIALAGRYENYSDFGSNVSGKLAFRYKLEDNIALRASINRGFRAPSLQQVFNSQTTSTVQSGVIAQTKQLRSDDARLKQMGISDPKPELSWNYNVGITAKIGNKIVLAVDAYRIDVDNRIILSEQFTVKGIPTLEAIFPTTTGISQLAFFTNQINTSTTGIDFVASYRHSFSKRNYINANIALAFNKTEITGQNTTRDTFMAGTKISKVIDTISISLIETSQPRTKIIASMMWQKEKFNASIKASYFGKITAWEKPTGGSHRSQIFDEKMVIDLTAGYEITKMISITLGVNNLLDIYPDKVYSNYASYFNGQTPYTRNAIQFGFNGAFYYATINVKF